MRVALLCQPRSDFVFEFIVRFNDLFGGSIVYFMMIEQLSKAGDVSGMLSSQ
jgi:hypothetical protein